MDSEIFELAREVGWMPIILYFLFKDKLAEVFNLKSSAGTQLDTINNSGGQVVDVRGTDSILLNDNAKDDATATYVDNSSAAATIVENNTQTI